ncbi:MAG: hypothetical protein JWO63_3431, partial [Frankiales bacterium]|nr:hypothetical protein [Frankiales bacterium]
GVLAVVLFIGAGVAAQNNWRIWQLYLHGQSFGQTDPQFHRDISFFAWDYPAYRTLLGFGFDAILFSLFLSLAVHYIFGAFRIVTPGPKLTISARRHITLLIFFFIVLKACAYWLDRYGLVFSDRGNVTGASYTDVHASLPAKTILFWMAVLIALAVLASLWTKSAQIATISFVVLLVLSIGINGIYPFAVQQLTVKPNASQKEAPYISRNIAATRQAYDIQTDTDGGDVTYTPYANDAPAPQSILSSDTATVDNIRITDPNVVSPTFSSVQKIKNVYGFPDKLDVDRYTSPTTKQTSDYIVGVRELKASNLTGAQTNWISEHTVYTHGYGFVAGRADGDVNLPSDFAEGGIPESGFLNVTQPQVYYGELGVNYSIVGGKGQNEYDSSDKTSTYAGTGGISLGNVFTRLAFAVKYQQTNFILNNAVSDSGAKIMFDRDPRERVQKVAPFLQVDGDPYPAVVNGRIVWILDGYTTIANYPYSERQSLSGLTADSLSTENRTAAQPNSEINYIRNSVKATVDAYDGTVTLYQWDPTDPVLNSWMKVFPGLVKPKADIPTDVLAHVRYPQDLFEVQRGLLQKYHVTDPVQFYTGGDQWTVPDDPTSATNANQPPYYVLAGADAGTGSAEYQLTSPMKVNNSQNMAAFISVDSEAGPDYGKFTVLTLPSGSTIQGPQQVYARFNSEPGISADLSLLKQGGSTVIEGNLLTLPIGNTFLYVEPLYVQGVGSTPFPLLQRVLVSYNGLIGYGISLPNALNNLVPAGQVKSLSGNGTTSPPTSSTPSSSPPSTSSPPTTSTAPTVVPSDVNSVLSQLDVALAQLQAAYKSGNFTEVGVAQSKIQQLTEQYLADRGSTATPKPSTTPKPSASPTK